MHRTASRHLLTVLLLITGAAATAAPGDFRSGVDAFKQQRYEDALRFFEAAYAAGRHDAALLYNLGSTQFKLGNYPAAYDAYLRIANDPTWGPLALYNLGLIDQKRHDEASAQRHFQAAYDTAPTAKLKQLAESKLAALPSAAAETRDWFGIASIAAGYDDNVVLLNDQSLQSVSNQDDYFSEALAGASRFISGDVERGWRADFSGYYRKYANQSDYDFGSASTGLVYNRISGRTQWQLGGKAEAQSVGGDAYAASGTLRGQLLRSLGPVSMRLRNDIAYVDGASSFGYLTGWQNRLSLQFARTIGPTALRFGYELELNNRRDDSTATEFFSYSPTWNRVYADASRALSDAFDVGVRTEYQISSYRDDNVQLLADGSIKSAPRDDDRISASIRLTYHASPNWDVFGEYSYSNNSSNFAEYEYNDNQIMIGIERPF